MRTTIKHAAVGLSLASAALGGTAEVIVIGERGSFNALGSIAYNSNFADFGSYYSLPGTPFTRGDVTYVSAGNVTVGATGHYTIGRLETVMSNNYWSPLTGLIATTTPYSLFGFDAAVTSGPVTITVKTNLGDYRFTDVWLPDGAANLAFQGYQVVGAGEYFTGLRVDTLGSGYLPGVTNVALGMVGAVTEPAVYALLAAGLSAVALNARRRRRK